MQKTPFQNSSPFSHSFKMFDCMSTQDDHEIRILKQFSPDMVSEIWLSFSSHLVFCYETFCKTLLGRLPNWKNTPGFNVIHSWPKETHDLEKYQISIDCNGISAVLRIPKHDIPLDISRYWENHLTFLDGVFCDLLQICVIKCDPAGVT